MTLGAAVLAGAAVVLAMSPPAVRGLRRLELRRAARRRAPWWVALIPLPVVVGLVLGVRVLGWVMAGAVAVGTVWWVVRQALLRRRSRTAAAETARAATTLSLLLRAGQIPTVALIRAADDCPALAPAAAALRLGAGVAPALLEAGEAPGRQGLAHLASAWQVSEQTGAPIAAVVAQVAERLREEQRLRDIVAVELSSARASSRIMAALPFVALGLGTLVGADPVGFLFGQPLGEVLFIAGIVLAAAGVVWTEKLAQSLSRGGGLA